MSDQEGQGSKPRQAAARSANSSQGAPRDGAPPRGGRILHVDDDEANRYAVTRTLLRAGYEVDEAASGIQALEMVTKQQPDLIILDIRLPDINGFEVCRRVKSDPVTASIPILHLSASFISSEDKAHGLDGGADAYLVRPVAPVELLATVNALMRVRHAEDALRLAKAEAEAARANAETANRIKDEFLATLSHELRTPLTAIIGWANILQRGRASPAELAEGLRTIERNAKAQAKLIEDLLDVSRIISGKLRLDAHRVEIASVLKASIDAIAPQFEAKHIRLEYTPDPAGPATWGDPARLQQVFWNLLSNAAKFTPEGGEVRVSVSRMARQLAVTIVDTGRGIAPEFLPHIFERFRQADVSSTRGQSGLGLGLAIVRQLVDLHGGSIRATSDGIDRGATFTVLLPDGDSPKSLADAGDASQHTNTDVIRAADEADGESMPLRGVHVLVIEDDTDCRVLAVHILEACGASVVQASSVAAAFEHLGRQRFDVIVSDIAMPGEDGYEFIRRLRGLGADAGGHTPALALSAFVQVESQRRMMESGFNGHLSKPVDPRQLCTAVSHLVTPARKDVTSPSPA